MPVTFRASDRTPEGYRHPGWGRGPWNTPERILEDLPTGHAPQPVLQSSVDGTEHVVVTKNGFVHGVVVAYTRHHNLIIRPDDVWIAILSQLNFYINAHAEELRHKFVNHKGKKTLTVTTSERIERANFGNMTVQMAGQIDEKVKDKSLVPWVLPNFTTTTAKDTVICSVMIMSAMKQYFHCRMVGGCGIPFITLEGTKADWQSILQRIEKLPEFGPEPKYWAAMLRAILKRFVRAFDKDGPKMDQEFWERMVHDQPGFSSPQFLSGWITAFCAWTNKGYFFGDRYDQTDPNLKYIPNSTPPPDWVTNLTFDGVWFPRVGKAPEGYVEVDVELVEMLESGKTKEYDCTMLAGHVGYHMVGRDWLERDTVRIAPQWIMYVKGEKKYHFRGFWLPQDR